MNRSLTRRLAQVAVTLVGAFALHGAATAQAADVSATSSATVAFQDPTKNIQCAVSGSAVSCIIRKQDKATCTQAFTASGTLKQTGKSVMNFGCFDKKPFSAKTFSTLKYGKAKQVKGVTCTFTKSIGVRCINKDKHGFTLNRKGSTSF